MRNIPLPGRLRESVAAAVAGGTDEFPFGGDPTTICQYANVGDVSYGKAFPGQGNRISKQRQ